MSEPVLKKPKIPKETSISEKPMPKPKALASGVSTVKIAGKDVLLKLNEQGVQELHVASFLAVVLNTDDNKASCYWRKKMENDTTLSDKVKKFSREMKFYNLGKIGIGIQFEAAIYILQNVKEKYASLDHCRSIVNELIQMYSGDKQRLWDLWDVFDSTFSDSVPLEEIVPNAKIEQKLVNGIQFLNIFDLLMFACNIKDRFEARRRWKNLLTHINQMKSETLKAQIMASVHECHFRSDPSVYQPGIRFEGTIPLMFILPGNFARAKCTEFVDILTRYYAGDKTLLKEVLKNAESNAEINMIAREALVNTAETANTIEDEQLKVYTGYGNTLSEVCKTISFLKENVNEAVENTKLVYGTEIEYIERVISVKEKHLEIEKKIFEMTKIKNAEDCSIKNRYYEIEKRNLELFKDKSEQERELKRKTWEDDTNHLSKTRTEELEYLSKTRDKELEYLNKKLEIERELRKTVAAETNIYDPIKHCTVAMVYELNKRHFPNKQIKDGLLVKTGLNVAELYKARMGLEPLTIRHGNKDVKFYVRDEYQNMILEKMKTIYCDLTQQQIPNQQSMVQFITKVQVPNVAAEHE